MRKYFINFAALFAAVSLASCDDGRIYPNDAAEQDHGGMVAKITGNITGQDTWADGYEVVLAAFDGESDYALTAKNIPLHSSNINMTMTAIPNEARRVELCVINRLRQRVATVLAADIAPTADPRDTIRINAGTADAGMLATLQDNVFTPRCATCHGGGQTAAAGVHLTAGRTYASIVGVQSHRVEGSSIVEPGNSSESVLNMMLHTDISAAWGYDHGNADISDGWKELITKWIDNGARQ